MKLTENNGVLILDFGFMLATHEIDIAKVKYWKFVAEENGATYYTFNLGRENQHVSVRSKNAEQLKSEINQISEIVGQDPIVEVAEARLPTGEIYLTADMSVSLLALLISAISWN